MPENKKPTFPQTPDGVTDWPKVFEDPDDGLIPLISSARTANALRQCAFVVINQLFTRKNDTLEVARLGKQLDALFAERGTSDDIEQLSEAIIGLLRQIKNERIQKAQEYLANKSKNPTADRRSDTFGQRMAANIYSMIKSPNFLGWVGGLILVMLLGIIGIGLTLFDDDNKSPTAESTPPEQIQAGTEPDPSALEERNAIINATPQPKPEQKSEPDLKPKPKPKSAAQTKESDMLPMVVLTRVFLPSSAGSRKKGIKQVMPILVLADPKDLSKICTIRPIIFDALNTEFSKSLNRDSQFTKSELASISIQTKNLLNKRLNRNAILSMRLVSNASHRDRASIKCQLASQKFRKYLPGK